MVSTEEDIEERAASHYVTNDSCKAYGSGGMLREMAQEKVYDDID